MKKFSSPITFIMLHKKLSEAFLGTQKQKNTRKKRRNRGFSLIELLTTVGIIGVLASVAIPAYNKYRISSNIGAVEAEVIGLVKAVEACLAAGGTFGSGANECGGPTVDGVVSCTAAGTAANKGNVTNNTICNVGTDKKSNLCVSSYKVTGGNWAFECRQYDAAKGTWAITTAKDELATDNTKYCKNDGKCT